jgi:hypothetical protein
MRITKYLLKKIQDHAEFNIGSTNKARDLIKKVVTYVSGNEAKAKKAIISALVELEEDKDEATTTEQNKFVDKLCLEISNMDKRLSGKNRKVYFAPEMTHKWLCYLGYKMERDTKSFKSLIAICFLSQSICKS